MLTAAGLELLEGLSQFHRDELRRFHSQMVDVLQELVEDSAPASGGRGA